MVDKVLKLVLVCHYAVARVLLGCFGVDAREIFTGLSQKRLSQVCMIFCSLGKGFLIKAAVCNFILDKNYPK